MSREDEAKNDRLFDSRTIERNIRKGLITRKDYDKHLKGLPDATDKIAPPEAPRSYAAPAAAVDVDHLDAGLDDDDEDQVRLSPPEPQRAAGEGDEEIVDGDEDDLEDDIEDDDEDEVDTDPPKN